MNLKKITLTNFKNFTGKHIFHFNSRSNLLIGANGSGKTTIALDALLFALYGYSDQALEKLVTKGKKTCSVQVEIDSFVITRAFPTKIEIYGKSPKGSLDSSFGEFKFANNNEKQKHLNKYFKNVDYFKKFRMIDVTKGINILEEGKTALKKTLFSFNEEMFNKIRSNLSEKKRQREIYNKDTTVIYKHFPSEKRFNLLNVSMLDITSQIYSIDRDIRNATNEFIESSNRKGRKENEIESLRKGKNSIMQYSSCPTCKRPMRRETKMVLVNEINTEITKINSLMESLMTDFQSQKELVSYLTHIKDSLLKNKDKLNTLIIKLSTRLKQKEFKWETKDVLVIKKALKELDSFMSFYLNEWIRGLEPIINSILKNIEFKVKFILNDKGDFDIKLLKNNQEYNYKELSTGQRLIFSIAFQLSLLMERGESGLIVADEGFSSLDSNNLSMVFNLFSNLPFKLLAIVHRIENISEGTNIIKL